MSKAVLSKTVQFQLLAPFNLQLENREGKWNEAIATLNSKAPFTITSDIKSLLRLGIPISQRVRFDLVIKHFWASDSIIPWPKVKVLHIINSFFQGAVWKAIVEKRVMRCGNEKFQKDYYNKLLANYNPSQKYTSAAKQVIN